MARTGTQLIVQFIGGFVCLTGAAVSAHFHLTTAALLILLTMILRPTSLSASVARAGRVGRAHSKSGAATTAGTNNDLGADDAANG